MQCLLHVLTPGVFGLQNRTSTSAPLPNNQQVYNAYGAYQMLQAAPGQIITLTWPRTADPDGTVADGSSQLNIYYNPNATINAGNVVLICAFGHKCKFCEKQIFFAWVTDTRSMAFLQILACTELACASQTIVFLYANALNMYMLVSSSSAVANHMPCLDPLS